MNQPDPDLTHPTDSALQVADLSAKKLLGRNTLFVASSRLTQKLDSIPGFFDGLLKLVIQLDPEKDVLLTSTGTACDRFVRRAGELFGVPVLVVEVVSDEDALKNAAENDVQGRQANTLLVFDSESRGADFALAMLAEQMMVLSIRKGGNLHKAVANRLRIGKPTRVLVNSTLTKQSLSNELLDLGATGWFLIDQNPDGSETPRTLPETFAGSDVDSSEYLLHWTRRRVGPWPDQSEAEFVDNLIFRSPGKDHRGLATLRRILATGQILASNDLTRARRPVVCFSEITFEELLQRRVFRPHLSRWDFEPFGIAIRKAWLKEYGARAVTYGDESVWDKLDDADRPFFQLNHANGKVDWSIEKEWRAVGAIDLRHVPSDAALVFVPSIEDACEVEPFSRWPVVVLSSKEN